MFDNVSSFARALLLFIQTEQAQIQERFSDKSDIAIDIYKNKETKKDTDSR